MRVFNLRFDKAVVVLLMVACAGCGGADRGAERANSAVFENVGSALEGGGGEPSSEPAFDSPPADIVTMEAPVEFEAESPADSGANFDEVDDLLSDLDDAEMSQDPPPLEPVEPPSGGGGGRGGGGGGFPFRVSPILRPSLPSPVPTLPGLSLSTDLPAIPAPVVLPVPNAAAPPQKAVTPEQEPATSVSQVDAIVNGLPYGAIVYNAPETMQYGEPTDLELLLSPRESAEVLRGQLRDPSNAVSSEAQIGNRMEAQLSGPGFAIEALSPALQAVTSMRATRWRWRVTPISHGPQELNLSLSAHLDVAGKDAPLVVETKDAVIQVEITFAQRLASFIEPNWQWLWGTVLFPIVGYRLRRRRRYEHYEPRRAAA